MHPTPGRHLTLINLGLCAYDIAHACQERAVDAVRQGHAEVLFLVEHPPTITLGRRADASNVLASPAALATAGITVHHTERGGDVTYHGPGQLVAYPILRLRDHRLGASDYMHLLEETVIRTLLAFGIVAGRRTGFIGVWVGDDKICALGVHVRGGVTMHGLALNIDPDMAHWAMIVPCGIREGGVTSMRALLGRAVPLEAVKPRLAAHLAEALGAHLVLGGIDVPDVPDLPTAGGPPAP